MTWKGWQTLSVQRCVTPVSKDSDFPGLRPRTMPASIGQPWFAGIRAPYLKPSDGRLEDARAKVEELTAAGKDYIVTGSEFVAVQGPIKAINPPRRAALPSLLQ